MSNSAFALVDGKHLGVRIWQNEVECHVRLGDHGTVSIVDKRRVTVKK